MSIHLAIFAYIQICFKTFINKTVTAKPHNTAPMKFQSVSYNADSALIKSFCKCSCIFVTRVYMYRISLRCITIYFEVLHGCKRFCCIRYTASTNSAYYSLLYLYTQTNHVCDIITLNYTSMTHCVGIY